jgi:hypothetical protein
MIEQGAIHFSLLSIAMRKFWINDNSIDVILSNVYSN